MKTFFGGTFRNLEMYKVTEKGAKFVCCTFINCNFIGLDAHSFEGCVFISCKMSGLRVNNINSRVFDDGACTFEEKESAMLGCTGISGILFRHPLSTKVFVSDDINTLVHHRHFSGSGEEDYYYWSENPEDYLKAS